MKWGKVLVYLLVLAALGAYVYFGEYRRQQKETAAVDEQERLVHLKKEAVTGLKITAEGAPTLELIKPKDKWVIAAPVKTSADDYAVSSLAHSLIEGKHEKLIKKGDVDWAEYNLKEPPFVVTLKTSDKTVAVKFGAQNPAKTSYYVRVGDDPELRLVADTLKNAVNKTLYDLRDKSIVSISDVDVQHMKYAEEGKEIELKRESPDQWRMTAPDTMRVNKNAARRNLTLLTSLQAVEIIDDPKEDAELYGLDKPFARIELSGEKGGTTLFIGAPVQKDDPESPRSPHPNRYAKINGRDTVYVVSGQGLKNLVTDPEKLRDRSILAFTPDNIDKLEVQYDGKSLKAERADDDAWKLTEPPTTEVKNWKLTSVLWDIKDMEWSSTVKSTPTALKEHHLDNPRFAAKLYPKGDKEPLILSIGLPDAPKTNNNSDEGPDTTDKTESAVKDDKGGARVPTDDADTSDSVYVTAQPSEEDDVIFIVAKKHSDRLISNVKEILEGDSTEKK
jgi:hypothetical protein